jgi:hypothetical protein
VPAVTRQTHLKTQFFWPLNNSPFRRAIRRHVRAKLAETGLPVAMVSVNAALMHGWLAMPVNLDPV